MNVCTTLHWKAAFRFHGEGAAILREKVPGSRRAKFDTFHQAASETEYLHPRAKSLLHNRNTTPVAPPAQKEYRVEILLLQINREFPV